MVATGAEVLPEDQEIIEDMCHKLRTSDLIAGVRTEAEEAA